MQFRKTGQLRQAECLNCGIEFRQLRWEQSFCSQSCGYQFRKKLITPKLSPCAICGATFKKSKGGQKTCSQKCSLNLRRKKIVRQYRSNLLKARKRVRDRNRRLSTDPKWKLAKRLRDRLYFAIRTQNARKSHRTLDLLGCSIDQFKEYIERKFAPGMTWENYGKKWHIDHIIPVASFDISDQKQMLQCFHWTNLQPLYAKRNLTKGDKITHPQFALRLTA